MSFLDKFKCLGKQNNDSALNQISSTLPVNEEIAKTILNKLGNKTSKVVFDKDIKNSYYVYFKDTIYISESRRNNKYTRVCLIAHECAHSMQSKGLQRVNFILSNIEILAFIICFIFILVSKIDNIFYIYLLFCIISIIPRGILEVDAIKKSLNISSNYLKPILNNKDYNLIMYAYTRQIKFLMPFAIITLFFEKILRCLILFLLTFLI
mgnify:CR=1 FL=1